MVRGVGLEPGNMCLIQGKAHTIAHTQFLSPFWNSRAILEMLAMGRA